MLYRHRRYGEDPRTVDVADLVALTPAVYLRLWQFLADIDLVQRVRWNFARPPTTRSSGRWSSRTPAR